jgi:serine/threonine-protein kinase
MSTSDRLIDDVAASVADGQPVDWDRPSQALSDRERRLLQHLRVIDSLATVYRSMPADIEEDDSTPPPVELAPDGPRWGRLLLLDRIGQGVSGDVFRAWDSELQREVALKLLHVDGVSSDAAANARVLQEARRLARVRHPHIVHVYGAERHEERIGLWMELVRGRTLDDIVRADGPMAPDAAAAIGADLCGAVAAVHAAGLLHRDIKCQNALRDDSGRVVLMDFGAGEEIGSGRTALAGTPLYLAPEVLAGGPASVASDVYSLGVLLFHLLTGKYPVQAESIEKLKAVHGTGTRSRLQDVAPRTARPLARIVDRALSPDPRERFATAGEMEQALRTALLPSVSIASVTWRTWAAVAVTAILAAALVFTVWHPSSKTPLADPTSIAVLPLTYISGQDDAPYFADGLTDELITTLGQVGALRVTAYTSVLRYRHTTESVASVAKALGVGSVLEGSVAVQRSGVSADPRVRVNLRLIRAGSDLEIWSDSFERPLSDRLALQSDIARAVTQSVHATLTSAEDARLGRNPQVNAQAQRAYLEGTSYLNQNRHGAELRPAQEAFEHAVALDPAFASAHAALARTYVMLGFDEEIPHAQAYASAAAAARKALSLDPTRPEAHTALADVSFYYDWNWQAAEAEYAQAVALDGSSSYARTQFSRLLAALGRLDEARQQAEAAVAVDPLSANVLLTSGLVAYYQRRYPEAEALLQRVVRMDPRFPGAYFVMGRIYEAQGRYVDAITVTDRAIRLSDTPPWRAQALRLRALAGDAPAATQGLVALKDRLARENKALEAPYEAYVWLALGERDKALDLLSEAVSARDPAVLWIAVDPRLDPVRDDARFRALTSRLGRP